MPEVSLELDINAVADRVWSAVVDIERYPDTMANVRWVRILDEAGPTRRRSAWSIVLKGSILEWQETEDIDHERRVMSFKQFSGDLETFDGRWTVEELEPAVTRVSFEVAFEIGIPLLADMLNPVAKRALRDNSTEMLLGVEREAIGAR